MQHPVTWRDESPHTARVSNRSTLHVMFGLQVEKPSDIAAADKLIFPGVGTFGQAMDVLKSRGYIQPLVDHIQVGYCSA